MDKKEAVQHIAKISTTLVVSNAANDALKTGNYDKALHIAANHGATFQVQKTAKEALGYKWNGRDFE